MVDAGESKIIYVYPRYIDQSLYGCGLSWHWRASICHYYSRVQTGASSCRSHLVPSWLLYVAILSGFDLLTGVFVYNTLWHLS